MRGAAKRCFSHKSRVFLKGRAAESKPAGLPTRTAALSSTKRCPGWTGADCHKGGGLSVILASVGFDEAQRGFAVLPALWAAFRQGRVAWGLLMVSSGAVRSELPSGLAVAKMVISCDGA